MATKKQKEELMQALKFTPATYRIELGAYGGECYIGRVDRKIYDFFKEHKIDIEEYASDWDDDKWQFIPDEMRPFPPGSPFECDNMCHASGPELSDMNYINVYNENNDEVWTCDLGTENLENAGCEVNCWEEEIIDEQPNGTVVFWGGQGEKGLLYGGEIELRAPFDPAKLKINYSNCDGWCIINGVEYDGEDISNDDYSSTGKWGENKWVIVGTDEEVYEGVSREDSDDEEEEQHETAWPESVCTSEVTEEDLVEELDAIGEEMMTEWYDASIKPTRKGEYEVKNTHTPVWPFPATFKAIWSGRTWKDSDGEKVENVIAWRGLKFDPAELNND